jgi:lipopolysaccharide/colanic/teichoic acid biosynthesis glycosyltransferase
MSDLEIIDLNFSERDGLNTKVDYPLNVIGTDLGNVPKPVVDFLKNYFDNSSIDRFTILRSRKISDISEIAVNYGLLNLTRFNNCIRINKYLEALNSRLSIGQYYIACFETMATRKARLFNRYGKFIGWPLYYGDFLLNRVLSKLNWTKGFYFWMTDGKNRVISLTEGLGRLVSCGFEIIDFKTIENRTYVITKKFSEPTYDMEPTYGALVKLRRIGKGGELFSVYKFRTMYPYSEYVQDFVFKQHDLQEGGKLKDDYRVTSWGRLFRRYWIDELPMLINWLKGEMKLVGVRPLSQHYFSLYPQDMQQLRTMVKPGLVPPFYVDMPVTLDEIIESEREYLKRYMDTPLRTDVYYFFKAFYNILFKKARSK